jgi:hypothetical protein
VTTTTTTSKPTPADGYVPGAGAAMDAAFAALIASSERRAEAERRADQTQAIRAAFAAGVSPTAMVRETGISRARLYQIRDGNRGYAVAK